MSALATLEPSSAAFNSRDKGETAMSDDLANDTALEDSQDSERPEGCVSRRGVKARTSLAAAGRR